MDIQETAERELEAQGPPLHAPRLSTLDLAL